MTRSVLAFPKPLRRKDRQYIRWIRKQGCLVCHRYAQAHHIHFGGVGTKGSDLETVPLCWKHHMELHAKGQLTFEHKYKLDLQREAARLLEMYLSALKDGEAKP